MRIASNDVIINGSNQTFKKTWIRGLEQLARSLMPASERIAGTKKDVKIVVDVLPIEPKGLALYYDAIRGYTSKRDDSHG